MGIEISKRVRELIEKDGRGFILDFPREGENFVSSISGNIIEQLASARECLGEIRLVLKKKPKWPAVLNSLPIDGFEVGHTTVFLYDSRDQFRGKIDLEILDKKEFEGFENGRPYKRSDCS